MFKKTMTLSELKQDINEELGALGGDDALQIVHRGKAIKVVITQERYFALLGLIDQLRAEPVTGRDSVDDASVETRKQRLRKKLEGLGDDENPKSRVVDACRVGSP